MQDNPTLQTAGTTFADLQLSDAIQRAVAETGYTTPTPIQAQAIPLVLQGGDLLASAQTGTGKTAGFTLPILHLLSSRPDHHQKVGRPRCLILTPTRELAGQVEESVKTYGKYLPLTSMVMFGGVGINPQIQALKRRVDIVVATPGRLLDHAGQKTIDLSAVEILVLDEADRMLDMGFIHDIRRVLALLPAQRQNLLFSATFSDEVKSLADRLLDRPGFVEVARRNAASQQVSQAVHLVAQSQKRDALVHLIKTCGWTQVLVFTRTKHGANRLAEYLGKHGISAAAIHGNKSQSARTQALAQFKDGRLPVLVATDIAARGLDIDQLPQVVNFELPNVAEDYVHRIGRTGRAGATGAALSLVDQDEIKLLAGIEKLIKKPIERRPMSGFDASVFALPEGSGSERASLPQRRGSTSGNAVTDTRRAAQKRKPAATGRANVDAGRPASAARRGASQPERKPGARTEQQGTPDRVSRERRPRNPPEQARDRTSTRELAAPTQRQHPVGALLAKPLTTK